MCENKFNSLGGKVLTELMSVDRKEFVTQLRCCMYRTKFPWTSLGFGSDLPSELKKEEYHINTVFVLQIFCFKQSNWVQPLCFYYYDKYLHISIRENKGWNARRAPTHLNQQNRSLHFADLLHESLCPFCVINNNNNNLWCKKCSQENFVLFSIE